MSPDAEMVKEAIAFLRLNPYVPNKDQLDSYDSKICIWPLNIKDNDSGKENTFYPIFVNGIWDERLFFDLEQASEYVIYVWENEKIFDSNLSYYMARIKNEIGIYIWAIGSILKNIFWE